MKRYLLKIVAVALLLLVTTAAPVYGQEPESEKSGSSGGQEALYHEAYYVVDQLNAGLPELDNPPHLQTPQAAVEHFVMASRNDNFAAAARALNLNLVPRQEQAERAPELARKLYYVLDHSLLVDWVEIPDRPDGQITPSSGNNSSPLAGQPRRSISLGSLKLNDRDIVIRLQRVKPGEALPVWVFSASTVENIEPIYQRFGPTYWDRVMPAWATSQPYGIVPLWEWIALVVILALAAIFVWLIRKLFKSIIPRINRMRGAQLAKALSTPLSLILGTALAYSIWKMTLTLTDPVFTTLNFISVLFVILAATWLVTRLLRYATDYISRTYISTLGSERQAEKRRYLTYLSVARWGLSFIALAIGISVALFQFDLFEAIGISLLTSAGVLSVIFGVAAQRVLSNIIAGIQIALSQPVRIGDNVNFDGDWSYIEEIAYTYLTLRTWDQRRIIVPFNYFLENPIENWEKSNKALIMPIVLYLDYTTDVKKIRQKFEELVHKSEAWDGETSPRFQVTDATEETIQIRAVVGANDPSTAWSLHCRIREELVAYIQQLENGRYLPKRRVVLNPDERTPLTIAQEQNHQESDQTQAERDKAEVAY